MRPRIYSAEQSADYIRAQSALDDVRKGNIGEFSWIQQVVNEKPFQSRGLQITEEEYSELKSKYLKWKGSAEK